MDQDQRSDECLNIEVKPSTREDLGEPETYASVFIDYMNRFNFEQEDMINPDDKVEYTAYLKNVEKTLSKYLDTELDINNPPVRSFEGGNRGGLNLDRAPKMTQNGLYQQNSERTYKKLKFTITSVHSQVLEMQ